MKKLLTEFKSFALRGSVLDLAVGVIIGAAFNGVVQSLVNDIIMPPIGYLVGNMDFSDLYFNLTNEQYQSLHEAKIAGAATINYGLFINVLISFLITAGVVFWLVKAINRWRERDRKEVEKTVSAICPFCMSGISPEAIRCPQCTSELVKNKKSK